MNHVQFFVGPAFKDDLTSTQSRNPTTGITGCCPLAATGHAAALPSSVMNADVVVTIAAA
jgi:hypothetical protein